MLLPSAEPTMRMRAGPAARGPLLWGWARRLLVAVAIVMGVIAAQMWSAFIRSEGCDGDRLANIAWGSVGLWVAIALIAWVVYSFGLACVTRDDEARLVQRLRRDGAP